MKSYTVKENYIGLAVSGILRYKQTDKHPVTLLFGLPILLMTKMLDHYLNMQCWEMSPHRLRAKIPPWQTNQLHNLLFLGILTLVKKFNFKHLFLLIKKLPKGFLFLAHDFLDYLNDMLFL